MVANAVPDGESYTQSYRWTLDDGWQSLGRLAGAEYVTYVDSVDGTGDTAIGLSVGQDVDGSLDPWWYFHWSSSHGMEALTALGLPGDFNPQVISDDGNAIGGHEIRGRYEGVDLVVWYADSGPSIIDTPAGTGGGVVDLSNDGRIALGYYRLRSDGISCDDFRRFISQDEEIIFEATNCDDLSRAGEPPIYLWNLNALSRDGQVAFGLGFVSDGINSRHCLLRWNEPDTRECVADFAPTPADFYFSIGVNEDGTRVVGSFNDIPHGAPISEQTSIGFVWDEGVGLRHIETFLRDEQGLDIGDLKRLSPIRVSADGNVVAGFAQFGETEAEPGVWVAVLESECPVGLGRFTASCRAPLSDDVLSHLGCGRGFEAAFIVPLVVVPMRRRLRRGGRQS